MLESTRSPAPQFTQPRISSEEKGFCMPEANHKRDHDKSTKTKLFTTPKFVASLVMNFKKSNELEYFTPKKSTLTKFGSSFDKKPLKKIEVIEENPYTFPGITETESYESLNDIDGEQQAFLEIHQANSLNIFRQRKKTPNFTEHNIGPRFTSDGKVIKRSIIGKTDAFLKMQNILFKNTTEFVPSVSRDVKSSMAKTITLKDRSSTVNRSLTSIHSASSFEDAQPGEPKKKKGAPSTISIKKPADAEVGKFQIMRKIGKDELLLDIEKAEQRQLANSENDKAMLKMLPDQDKRFFTKEERIIERFNKTQELWKRKTELVAHKVKRKIDSCVMAKTDEYRLKLENAQALELLKNDDEKYGNKLWYLTLRDYPKETRPETNTIFKKSKMNFNKNNLEIVRKNTIDGHKSPKKLMTAYGPNEYLDDKLMKNKKKLDVILPTDDDNFIAMQIVGHNKFESEANVFRKDNFNSRLYFKRKPIKYEQQEVAPETYVETYFDKELFTKTGSNIFPKITSTFTF